MPVGRAPGEGPMPAGRDAWETSSPGGRFLRARKSRTHAPQVITAVVAAPLQSVTRCITARADAAQPQAPVVPVRVALLHVTRTGSENQARSHVLRLLRATPWTSVPSPSCSITR